MCQICFQAALARLEAGEALDFSDVAGGLAPRVRTAETVNIAITKKRGYLPNSGHDPRDSIGVPLIRNASVSLPGSRGGDSVLGWTAFGNLYRYVSTSTPGYLRFAPGSGRVILTTS